MKHIELKGHAKGFSDFEAIGEALSERLILTEGHGGFVASRRCTETGSVAKFRISVALPGASNQTRHFP
jgi:hypothetical protein